MHISITWGGGYSANFLRSVAFQNVQHCQNIRLLLTISFIYFTDTDTTAQLLWQLSNIYVIQMNLTSTFARSKILLMEKLMSRALVNTHLRPQWVEIDLGCPEKNIINQLYITNGIQTVNLFNSSGHCYTEMHKLDCFNCSKKHWMPLYYTIWT